MTEKRKLVKPPPERLYKYTSFRGDYKKYAEQLLIDCEIYYSSPSDFNDPFDCALTFSPEGTEDEWVQHMSRHLKQMEPHLKPIERLKKARHHIRAGKHLKELAGVTRQVTSRYGVYCLSAKRDDILMWSHYADKHRGFVVEFDATYASRPFCTALEIDYRQDYAMMTIQQGPQEAFETLMLAKSNRWRYEGEYRMIQLPDKPRIRRIEPESIVGIYFGSQMSDADGSELREIINRGPTNPKIHQFRVSESQYILEIAE